MVFSLAGIPPLGGFFAKFAIFASCAEVSLYLGALVGLLTSAIGILYYLRIVKLLNFEEKEVIRPHALTKTHALVMGLTSFFLIFFILISDFVSSFTYLISLST